MNCSSLRAVANDDDLANATELQNNQPTKAFDVKVIVIIFIINIGTENLYHQ